MIVRRDILTIARFVDKKIAETPKISTCKDTNDIRGRDGCKSQCRQCS